MIHYRDIKGVMVKREIESTDRQIDKLVYELSPTGMIYGLAEYAIRIVKGNGELNFKIQS